jgi:Ser/Thr protein kinase RdoA (MazF antagonist)
MYTTTEKFSLPIPLEQALSSIAGSYQLGMIQGFSVMLAGYHNLNVKFSTQHGSFVAKFYSSASSLERNTDVVTTMLTLHNCGLPVPKVLHYESGTTMPLFKDDILISYANVLEYFDGEDSNTFVPSNEDIRRLAQIVGKLHNIDLSIERFYDDWGVSNIVNEYAKTADSLRGESVQLVANAVKEFEQIDCSSFHRCVIHGDLHRSNILKNKNGHYCLIDFGCVDYNVAVIDLAAFLAWFCFDGLSSFTEMENIYRIVLNEYIKIRLLSEAELAALPVFVRAAYAAFHMASSELIAQGDTREETLMWNQKSLAGLKKGVFINKLHY